MAGAVSLNDVAKMLSTKSGDMSTIGGAIGCMSAMISADAREKDNTFSNDIKKLKEFVCGSGGDMSSMFQYLGNLIQEQTAQIEKLAEGDKEKKLVRKDITQIIKKATDGLEKRLDKIIDSLHVIAKSQGGNIKWGNTKKVKDSVDKFKMSLEDQKKLKDSKIGQVVKMLTELKAISLKDLVTFKPKLAILEKLTPKINDIGKSIDEKKFKKVEDFLYKAPEMIRKLIYVTKLSKKINNRDFERLYKILGIGSKKAEKNTIFGLVDSLSKVDKKKMDRAKKNVDTLFGIIKDMCIGITMFVTFSPVIIIGGLLVKPVEWALFGAKGKGGLIGLFKKLNKNKKTIKEANKAIMQMSLGLVCLGLGLGTLFALTKRIYFENILMVSLATTVMIGVTVLMGKFKKEIKKGSEAMLYLSAGLFTLGLGFGVLFKTTKNIEFEDLAVVAAATVGFTFISVLMSKFKKDIKKGAIAMTEMGLGLIVLGLGLNLLNKLTRNLDFTQLAVVGVTTIAFGTITAIMGKFKKNIKEGAIAIGVMGLGLVALGLGLGVLFALTKNVTWEQMAMVGVSMVFLGGATIALGAINKDGLVYEGAIAMGIMGAALIPFGISMRLLMGSVKGLKWSEFGMFAATLGVLGVAVIGLGALMCTGFGAIAWVAGIGAIAGLGMALIPFGIGLNLIKKAAKGIDLKAVDNMASATKTIFKTLSEVGSRKERKNARKNAKTLKDIGHSLKSIVKSLKKFNDLAPDAVDKAMDALTRMADFFFGEKGLSKYSVNWWKRMKATSSADTIGMISKHMRVLSKSLKTFNDVAPDSIDKAMNAINRIAEYFFSETSPLNKMNVGWNKRRKAEKTTDSIFTISESIWKLATGLKDFNEVSSGSIDKAMDSVGKIAEYFFSENSPLNTLNTSWRKRRKAERTADTIGVISESMYKISQSLKDFNEIGSKATDTMISSFEKIAQSVFSNESDNISDSKSVMMEKSMKRLAEAIRHFDKKTKDIDSEKISKYIQTVNSVTSEILGSWKPEYEKNATSIQNSMSALVSSFKGGGREYVKMARVTRKLFKQLSKPSLQNADKTISGISELIGKFNELNSDNVKSLMNLFGTMKNPKGVSGLFSSLSKNMENVEKDNTIDKMIAKIEKTRGLLDNIAKMNENSEVDKVVENINKLSTCLFDKNDLIVGFEKSITINKSLSLIGKGLSKYNKTVGDIDMSRIKSSIDLTNKITNEVIAPWKTEYLDNSLSINKSLKSIVTSFDGAGRDYKSSVNVTRKLFQQMSSPVFIESGKTISRLNSFVGRVNTIEMDKVSSLTDLFKSFASIGKGGNIFSKFDKRVQQFTEACIELVNAINGNTDAINNSEEEVVVKNEFGEEETVKRKDAEFMPKQMTILNINELADAIAEKMNEMNVDCDANINLQINNESGNEWRITRM